VILLLNPIVEPPIGLSDQGAIEALLSDTRFVTADQENCAPGPIKGEGDPPATNGRIEPSSFMFACRDPLSVSQ